MHATLTIPLPASSPSVIPTSLPMRVCRLSDLEVGIGRNFDIAGRRITLFRTRTGMLHATDATCPHAGAPLADGIVAHNCVVCPYHARRFDLNSGKCDDANTPSIRTYPVSLHGDWVSITLPD